MGAMMPRRVVVTGGAGFIGSHLCEALLARGDEVLCVDNLVGTSGSTRNIEHLLSEPRFHFAREDVVEWAAGTALEGVDTIFHQAASKNVVCLRDPERDLVVNGLGTLRLLRAAVEYGVRKFVHASTGSVYGPLTGPQDENHPRRPVSFYGISKTAGESYCFAFGQMHSLDFTVFRYFHVIGERQDDTEYGGVVPIFIRNCLEGVDLTIYGTGEQVRSFTSVHDVVQANLWAADASSARQEVFNCASGIRVTIQELAEFVIRETGAAVSIQYMPWRAGDIKEFRVDNSRLRNRGVRFDTDWQGSVRRVIEWKKSQAV
jgi:UDP-glucose 4-epimerase